MRFLQKSLWSSPKIVKNLYLNVRSLWQTKQSVICVCVCIKCVVRWSENSVRCEKSYGNWLPDGPNSVRVYLTVWDMACMDESAKQISTTVLIENTQNSLVSFVKLILNSSALWRLLSHRMCGLQHDKTNKMSVRSAKTQISLGIHPVWSESSRCPQWVDKDPHSEDSDRTGQMPRLIWVFAGCTVILFV